jgi:5,10-methylenetetrahydromethanopterin reductase
VPGIGLGTGVVPVYPRHPMMLAQQALTVQLATGNRLILGIGLSHQVVVEGMWGMSFDKPARYMKEYLAALMPLLHGETGQRDRRARHHPRLRPLDIADVTAPPVLVAALGDTMLKLAGRVADGTVTWMTGTKTIESHIPPSSWRRRKRRGGRRRGSVVALPVSVTATSKRRGSASTRNSPSTRTCPPTRPCWTRRGREPGRHRLRRGRGRGAASIEKLAAAGATDFVASIVGNRAERERTFALLSEIARSG